MHKIQAKQPLYKAVQDELLALIVDWDRTKPIPSETRLSEELGVSRSTVREALQRLERAEMVYKKHGVGTFVGRQANLVATALNDIRGVQNIIRSSGKSFSLKRHEVEALSLPERVASVFGEKKGIQSFKIAHVYLADGIPTLRGTSYIAPALVTDGIEKNRAVFLSLGDKGMSLFDILEQRFASKVAYAVTRIEARNAGASVARDLGVDSKKAVVQLNQIHYDAEHRPLIYSEDIIDTDVVELIVLRRSIF